MKERLLDLLSKELSRLKNSGKEINLMLSGGVDSSTLLAAFLHFGIEPNRIISVRLPYGPSFDDHLDMLMTVDAFNMRDKLVVVELQEDYFFTELDEAIKIIGKPTPHFNIWPLYVTFRNLAELGIEDVVVGDGPDESMCGYTRHLIMNHFYNAKEVDAFKMYEPTIDKIELLDPELQYARLAGLTHLEGPIFRDDLSLIDNMCWVDMKYKRPEMMDMSHGLANNFGIKIHAPYEESYLDLRMFGLDKEYKIDKSGEYGKYLLRQLAEDLGVPVEIAWRKHKMGGPVVPVNRIAGWAVEDPFDKSMYLAYQEDVLDET